MLRDSRKDGKPEWSSGFEAFRDGEEPTDDICDAFNGMKLLEPLHMTMSVENSGAGTFVEAVHDHLGKQGLQEVLRTVRDAGKASRFVDDVERWISEGCKRPCKIRMPR